MNQTDHHGETRRLILVVLGAACSLIGTASTAQEPNSYPSTELASPAPLLSQDDYVGYQSGGLIVNDACNSGDYYGSAGSYGRAECQDWDWGCGGFPFHTGPGTCDNWRVGPIWDVAIDGMTLFRPDTDLDALEAATAFNSMGDPLPPAEYREQFDYNAGARIFVTGKVPRYVGYQLQFGYEGVDEWNAAVVFPKIPSPIAPAPPPPGGPPPISERRTVNYRSSFHSAELNILRTPESVWRPYVGFRFIRFEDEIRDDIAQAASPPLPGDPPAQPVITSNWLNLFDLDNNLVGMQWGIRRDLWRCGKRFSLQGFVNAGIYCNLAKRTNTMTTTTTQVIADDTAIPAMGDPINEARRDVSTASNTVSTELTQLAYLGEASLTGICRINKCLALRTGYQVLWINGLHRADDAFLNSQTESRSLLFQGFHAGVEYRR